LIGIPTPAAEQHGILQRLGFEVNGSEVTTPTWRARDVTREVDVVEEIARFRLPAVPFTYPLRRAMFGRLTRNQRFRRRLEEVLTGIGFSEVYTPSLVGGDPDPAAVRLPEPINAELAVLRTTLLPSLVEAARRNAELGNDRIDLFEIARVYLPSGGPLPVERIHVAGITQGAFSRAKGVVEALARGLKFEAPFKTEARPLFHPARSAATTGGFVGELHPAVLEGEWSGFELDIDELAATAREPVEYREVGAYPAVHQDLAFVVDVELPVGDVIAAIREAGGADLRDVGFLSDYREAPIPAGKKSIAVSVSFQSAERTLTDEDAAASRQRIVDALQTAFGAELRA
jgi:phenylalanyl-tRNA synthetase beta chain